jgi:hypothetical protein
MAGKVLSPPHGSGSCGFLDVVELPNGEFVAAGVAEVRDTLLTQDYESQQVWTVRVDPQGQLLRSKTWGVEEFPLSLLPSLEGIPTSNAWSLCLTRDSMLALTGRIAQVNSSALDPLIISDMLMKVDTGFQLQWVEPLAHQRGQVRLGLEVIQDDQGDYYLGGQVLDTLSGTSHVYLSSADASGQLRWDSLYLQSPLNANATGIYSLTWGTAGELLAAGRYLPFGAPNGKYDAFILGVQPANGSLLSQDTYGFPGLNEGFFAIERAQNGYWAAGTVEQTAIAFRLNSQLIPQDTLWLFYPTYQAAFLSVLPIPRTDSVVLAGTRYQPNNGFDSADVLFVSTAYDSVTCSPSTPIPSYRGGIIIQIDDINTKWQRICQVQSFLCDTITSILSEEEALSWRVFPNPSRGLLRVECDLPQAIRLELWDMQGRKVAEKQIRKSGRFELEWLPKGVYALRASSMDGKSLGVRRVLRQ